MSLLLKCSTLLFWFYSVKKLFWWNRRDLKKHCSKHFCRYAFPRMNASERVLVHQIFSLRQIESVDIEANGITVIALILRVSEVRLWQSRLTRVFFEIHLRTRISIKTICNYYTTIIHFTKIIVQFIKRSLFSGGNMMIFGPGNQMIMEESRRSFFLWTRFTNRISH